MTDNLLDEISALAAAVEGEALINLSVIDGEDAEGKHVAVVAAQPQLTLVRIPYHTEKERVAAAAICNYVARLDLDTVRRLVQRLRDAEFDKAAWKRARESADGLRDTYKRQRDDARAEVERLTEKLADCNSDRNRLWTSFDPVIVGQLPEETRAMIAGLERDLKAIKQDLEAIKEPLQTAHHRCGRATGALESIFEDEKALDALRDHGGYLLLKAALDDARQAREALDKVFKDDVGTC